jgi:hypothetical protein
VTTPTLSLPRSPLLTSAQTAVAQYKSTSENFAKLLTTSPLKASACGGTSPPSLPTPAQPLIRSKSSWLSTCSTASLKSSLSGLRIVTTISARETYGRSILLSPLSKTISATSPAKSLLSPSSLSQSRLRRNECLTALTRTTLN